MTVLETTEKTLDELIIDVTIDKITVLGNVKDKHQFIRSLELSLIVGKQITSKSYWMYRYAYELIGNVGIICFEPIVRDIPFVRYQFNPKYRTDQTVREEQDKILSMFKDGHLSRLDVAIDTRLNVREMKILDEKERKRKIVHGRYGRLETVYIGSRESETYIRIYDKKAEKENKGETLSEPVYWRIEAEIKRDKANTLLEENEALRTAYNPFDGVKLVGYWKDVDVEQRIILDAIADNPDLLHQMPKRKRQKYRKLIQEKKDVLFDPAEVYKKNKAVLAAQLRRILNDIKIAP